MLFLILLFGNCCQTVLYKESYYCRAADRISSNCDNVNSATFHSWPWERNETCTDFSSDAKHFILYFKRKMFCIEYSLLDAIMMRINDGTRLGSVVQCTELNKDSIYPVEFGKELEPSGWVPSSATSFSKTVSSCSWTSSCKTTLKCTRSPIPIWTPAAPPRIQCLRWICLRKSTVSVS